MYDDTTFFSLNKKSDWEKGTAYHLHLSDGGVELERTERFGYYRTLRMEHVEGPRSIADLAVGGNGKLYLLDHAAALWIYDYENHFADLLLPAGHGMFTARAQIAVAGDLMLVAENGITAYSLTNGQAVWAYQAWQGMPLQPVALAVDVRQQAYALFPISGSELGVLRVRQNGAEPFVIRHGSLNIEEGTPPNALRDRFFLTVGRNGRVYVLDGYRKRVNIFDEQGAWQGSFELSMPIEPSGLGIDPFDGLYVSDRREVETDWEDDRFVLHLSADGRFLDKVAGFRGRADKLLIGSADRMYVWNRLDNMITVLEQQPRTKVTNGLYYTQALDCRSAETVWHKIVIEGHYPDETQLRVSYFASDRRDLDEFIHDPHMSLEEKERLLKGRWSEPIINPRDALIRAQGQYLWLKIEWSGSEKKSPRLGRLRVYYPRRSYLDDLPAVYQQDERSRDFMERFLSLFGTFFDEMEETIDHLSQYFDVDSSSGDLLRWLAAWLGIAVDERWTDAEIRELMKRSPELFQKRGTRAGMEEMVEIFTGQKPFIVEFFQYKHLIDQSDIRSYMEQLYGLDPYRFSVLLKPGAIRSEAHRQIVQKIIEEEKPAFAEAELIVLEPRIYMGSHSYLGINTFLSEPTVLVLDDKSSMPYNTVLIDIDRNNRIGLHTRLGLDSELE
ncbi:MAG: phage tail protein [Tumebacillaceae bacterium]